MKVIVKKHTQNRCLKTPMKEMDFQKYLNMFDF